MNSIKLNLALLFSALIMLLNLNAYSQESGLKGKVMDANTGEPVPYANIYCMLADSFICGATTDENGLYMFRVQAGSYVFFSSLIGYASDTLKIKLGHEWVTHDFNMKVVSYDLDAVEINADIVEHEEMMASTVYVMESKSLACMPGRASRESAASFTSDPAVHPSSDVAQAGVLTAGRINDFGKWELWTDIAGSDLNEWQKFWGISPLQRYTLQLQSQQGSPLADAEVSLMSASGKVLWVARTDNTGKAECWPQIFKSYKKKDLSFSIQYQGFGYNVKNITEFHEGINLLKLPVDCSQPKYADIAFVVDATGSMTDELEYLKQELLSIIQNTVATYPDITIRLGCVFYRDRGDEYITRKFDFTTDFQAVMEFIGQQVAAGGNDTPEAVDQALDTAINSLSWSQESASRILFLVCDAPPHGERDSVIKSIKETLKDAAGKGIRFIPLAGSGIDKSTEYLLRSFALATNGTYIFLTDHSGVGGTHLKPTTDSYDVMLLNVLLEKIISEYLYMPPCNDSLIITDISDTMFIKNPALIAVEVGDSNLIGKYQPQIPDTNNLFIQDSNEIAKLDSILQFIAQDTLKTDIEKGLDPKKDFLSLRYYPNPTSGLLNIVMTGHVSELFLADISGKLLEKYPVINNEMQIDISAYPSGTYYLQYFLESKWLTGKIVLMK
jgi:hypothetical protein